MLSVRVAPPECDNPEQVIQRYHVCAGAVRGDRHGPLRYLLGSLSSGENDVHGTPDSLMTSSLICVRSEVSYLGIHHECMVN
jgi:hypothetical protein